MKPMSSPLDAATQSVVSRHGVSIFYSDVMDLYDWWDSPIVIISDGPYGVAGFPGDPPRPEGLPAWYEAHIAAWSRKATPLTTLWFWNTELGWANVHPVLVKHGWTYRACHIWDKGIAHAAGNSNTKSLRKLPIVTEVCVQYVKEADFGKDGQRTTMQEWLRSEWERTGLPFSETNEACRVHNAATRKYFTKCHLWYYPPVEAFEQLVAYANKYGKRSGRPYFSIEGRKPLTGKQWAKMRAKFYCEHGITNVWCEPAVRGEERLKNGSKCIHTNQKPLRLVELAVRLSSDPGDLVWEPFGGLCSVAVACLKLKRRCVSAELIKEFFEIAARRLETCDAP